MQICIHALCDEKLGAAAIELLTSVGSLGGFVSPPLIGWSKDTTGGLLAGLIVSSACAVASALLAVSMPGPRTKPSLVGNREWVATSGGNCFPYDSQGTLEPMLNEGRTGFDTAARAASV
jgi:hypothetical protein